MKTGLPEVDRVIADMAASAAAKYGAAAVARIAASTLPSVATVMSNVESRLAGNGRLLVHYSGTEPLLRVMLEGQNESEIRQWGQEIVDAVKEALA